MPIAKANIRNNRGLFFQCFKGFLFKVPRLDWFKRCVDTCGDGRRSALPGRTGPGSPAKKGEKKISMIRNQEPIQIGLVSDEPMRLAGLAIVFDQPALNGKAPLLAITGSLQDLLTHRTLEYLVVDLHASPRGLAIMESIRRARPGIRLIVIGPAGNDECVLEAIMAGARAYLDQNADPAMVRQAIEVVTGGSIWAPRRLLSKLIDRLLKVPNSSLTTVKPHLTIREKEVLELILLARSNREIAHHLGIEERTVKAHVGRLMRKTGSDNRIELSMCAINRTLAPHTRSRPVSKLHHPAGMFTAAISSQDRIDMH